jgi:pilus assembly protein Flp/PilA
MLSKIAYHFCKVLLILVPTFFLVYNLYKLKRWEINFMLFAPKDKGQGLVEYALILVLVAVVVIVILALLGPAIGKIFSNVIRAV